MVRLSIDVVIVTYNRLQKLQHALECYELQTVGFNSLIVVNNNSDDGTSDFLSEWSNTECEKMTKVVLNSKENLGGSGGFYLGQTRAIKDNVDWVFIADDDAYPELDLFEKFQENLTTVGTNGISAVCTTVLNPDGSICTGHRGYLSRVENKVVRIDTRKEEYLKDYFRIDFLSYVGSFLFIDALREVGLVNKRFFIYYDDTEHSIRLRKYGSIVCVPELKVLHDYEEKCNNDVIVSWSDYYAIRNRQYIVNKYWPLSGITYYLSNIFMLLRKQNDPYKDMRNDALKDALFGRMGLNEKYQPGWCVKK